MNHSDRKDTTPISSRINNGTNNTHSSITDESSNQFATAPSVNSPRTVTTSVFNNNANIQQPRPITYGDRHFKEFPFHQFERNLTIEKATFEPPAHQSHAPSPSQQQQTPRTVPSPQQMTIATAHTLDNGDSAPADTSVTANPPATNVPAQSLIHHPPTQIQIQPEQHDTFTTSSPTKIPEKPLNSTTKRYDAIPHSPPRATLASNKKKPPVTNETEKQLNKKKSRKLPGVNGTATPSEVFHRNLVDAVSNVEDSDEHEQYVYPYSHHDPSSTSATTSTAATARSNKNRNQQKYQSYTPAQLPHSRPNSPSISSAPGSSLSLHRPRTSPSHSLNNSTTSLLKQATDSRYGHNYKYAYSPPPPPSLPASSSQQQQYQNYYRYGSKYQQQHQPTIDEERGLWGKRDYYRPKLRSHVMDHNALPQPWAHEVSSSDDDDDDETDDHYNYRHFPDGERVYLLQHSQRRLRRSGVSCAKVLRNTCISVLIFIIVMMVLTVYQTYPLTDVSASMQHILASDKELIFDLMVKGNNWNWWTVRIQEGDLSMFGFSQLVPLNTTLGVDPAEYLGSFQCFDQPLSFTSSAILGRRQQVNALTQIRIKSPGADPSGNQRWSRMIRYPFGLVLRGVLNYRPLPLFNLSPRQSIPVCIVTHIDPISPDSPSLSYFSYNDSDNGYCSQYPPVSPIL